MGTTLILVKDYCTQSAVEETFIRALYEEGLIEVRIEANEWYIDADQLRDLEQFRQWHYDLHINVEGIDAMRHLVKKIRTMQAEIGLLKNRLRLHEEGW
ncbi:chaperone modulator CbpM [Olivibacter sp. XZL3]|uniref:chaperone modulator CbpM n=1 Tax=Olivibacter sp. XZL3 TaxID=1735116 RepID=UPI00106569BF|nr:chaperone modulator CbpM [Olivibacter sp. XZL3]